MKLLLDTHVFLWALAEPERIKPKILSAIESSSNSIFVSAVSVAEIAIKASLGKLDVQFDPAHMIGALGFERLDFSVEAAFRLVHLPFHHRDPFDRMLVAQAQEHRLTIATHDAAFERYECNILK